MNVRSLRVLILFTATVLIISCHKDRGIVSEPAGYSEIVSLEAAREVAVKFANNSFSVEPGPTAISSFSVKNIEQEETISEDGTPYFYIFNFKEKKGFVIVSAERREHPILAYNSKGTFKRANAPYGIVGWIEDTKETIENIRQGMYDTKEQTAVEWALIEALTDKSAAKEAPPFEEDCQDYTNTVTVGPLIATEWGQGCFYNTLCPANTSGLRCGHVPTGCVATAIAQVMRYWQWPNTYNWASMPNNTGNLEVARLMRDVGTAVNMNYNDAGSGAKHSNIPGAFVNTFSYSTAQNSGYGSSSYMTVRAQINSRQPVLLCGCSEKNTSWLGLVVEYEDCHEWVCDGFNDYDVYWCDDDGMQHGVGYLFFHMNWGWDGASNGWFGFNNWAPSGTSFNFRYQRGAIINIRP